MVRERIRSRTVREQNFLCMKAFRISRTTQDKPERTERNLTFSAKAEFHREGMLLGGREDVIQNSITIAPYLIFFKTKSCFEIYFHNKTLKDRIYSL